MTQEQIFEKALAANKEVLGSVVDGIDEKTKEYLINVAECYNNMIELIKKLNMTKQQKDIFTQKASKFLYNERQLSEIAFSICNLYKSEFEIKEDATEKLDLLCNPENSPLRMSQIHIGIVKDLTLDEIKECMMAKEEDIVETTKKIYCRHYNKNYIEKQEIEEQDETIR